MVNRYTYRYAEDGDLYRHEEPDGKYVLHSDYAALERELTELREAVRWERECEAVRNKNRMFRNWPETVEAERSYDAARAEVDRLMAEGEG